LISIYARSTIRKYEDQVTQSTRLISTFDSKQHHSIFVSGTECLLLGQRSYEADYYYRRARLRVQLFTSLIALALTSDSRRGAAV